MNSKTANIIASIKSDISQHVDHLFKTASNRGGSLRYNPVTGGCFVRGLDSVLAQKRAATDALLAMVHFAMTAPADAQPLPLTQAKREERKSFANPLGYMVALYARSLACCDYKLEGHPEFDEYARGALACPYLPEQVREDPVLRQRFPPQPIPGFGPGAIWRGSRGRRTARRPR